VGKTEIARRLAQLIGAPFVKVEATKFTEVGYVGRDVESIIRDLAEAGAAIVRQQMHAQVREKAQARVREKLLDLLLPSSRSVEDTAEDTSRRRASRSREKLAAQLDVGLLEDRIVTVEIPKKGDVPIFAAVGIDHLDPDLRNLFEQIMPRSPETAAGARN